MLMTCERHSHTMATPRVLQTQVRNARDRRGREGLQKHGGAPAPWGRWREGALGGLGIGADGGEIRVGSWEGMQAGGPAGRAENLPFPVPKVSSPGFPPGTSQGSQARMRVPWDSSILGTLWKVQGLRPLGQSQEPQPSGDEVRSRGSDGRTGCGGSVNRMPGVGATTSLTSMPQDQTLLRQVTVQGNPGRRGRGHLRSIVLGHH